MAASGAGAQAASQAARIVKTASLGVSAVSQGTQAYSIYRGGMLHADAKDREADAVGHNAESRYQARVADQALDTIKTAARSQARAMEAVMEMQRARADSLDIANRSLA